MKGRVSNRKSKAVGRQKSQAGFAAPSGSASSKDPVRKKGVLIPADNSFEAINRFVNHFPSPEYEELQWALLGLAAARENGK